MGHCDGRMRPPRGDRGMDACSHGALCPWCLTVVVHALAVDMRWGESSETLQRT
jgi:hypothetical protein